MIMKTRGWILTAAALIVAFTALSGCVVVPARGYYGGGGLSLILTIVLILLLLKVF